MPRWPRQDQHGVKNITASRSSSRRRKALNQLTFSRHFYKATSIHRSRPFDLQLYLSNLSRAGGDWAVGSNTFPFLLPPITQTVSTVASAFEIEVDFLICNSTYQIEVDLFTCNAGFQLEVAFFSFATLLINFKCWPVTYQIEARSALRSDLSNRRPRFLFQSKQHRRWTPVPVFKRNSHFVYCHRRDTFSKESNTVVQRRDISSTVLKTKSPLSRPLQHGVKP